MATAELVDAPTTELAKPQPINWKLLREQALATFDVQSEAIAKEVAADTQLKVTDDNTRKAAKERHWVWVKRRTGLEKTRKEAVADAQAFVKFFKEVADSFQSEFDKAEQHLAEQIDAFDAEIERKKKEAEDAAFNAKNDRLLAVGLNLPRIYVETLTDDDIAAKVTEAQELARLKAAEAERQAAEKAEADRKAAELAEANRKEAERLAAERAEFARQQAELKAEQDRLAKIEADRLAAERAELDRQRQEQEAEQRKIDEEKARLAKAESDRLAEIERQRLEAEAAERAKIESEEKAKRDAETARLLAEQQERDRLHAEKLRPDKEKLLAFADTIGELSEQTPDVSKELQPVADLAASLLVNAMSQIREKLK